MTATPPAVLVFAGYDPTGGAGVLADVEAIRALGATPYAVITALTAQGPRGVSRLAPVTPALIDAQLEAAGPVRFRAIKIGMVGDARNARALARLVSRGAFEQLAQTYSRR